MKNQKQIAKMAGITPSFLSYLLAGKKSATYLIALRLGKITKSKPAIWLKGGGSPEDRRDAINNLPE